MTRLIFTDMAGKEDYVKLIQEAKMLFTEIWTSDRETPTLNIVLSGDSVPIKFSNMDTLNEFLHYFFEYDTIFVAMDKNVVNRAYVEGALR